MDMPELDGFIKRFKNGPRIVTEELTTAGKRSGLMVERLAKSRSRVWRGHLRRSVTTKTTVQPLMVTTKVGSNLPYAPVMNFGRRAGAPPPPTGPIAAWLKSKGGDPRAAFVVARAIGRRGIPGDFFLTGSLKDLRPQIQREFRAVPKRVIARLRSGG